MDSVPGNQSLDLFRDRVGIHRRDAETDLFYPQVIRKLRKHRFRYRASYSVDLILSVFQIVIGVAVTVLTPTDNHRTAVTILDGFNASLAAIISTLKALKWSEDYKSSTNQLENTKYYLEAKDLDIVYNEGEYDLPRIAAVEKEGS